MKNLSKKTWMIIGAAIAVVAVIVIVLLVTNKKTEAPATVEDPAIVTESAPKPAGKRPKLSIFGQKSDIIKPGQSAGTTSPDARPTTPVQQTTVSFADLSGTQYRLASFNETSVPDTDHYILSFDGERLSAKFCNGLGGTYTIKGNTIQAREMVGTMMYCEEPSFLMGAEQSFGKLMEAGATYAFTSNTLTLAGAAGTFVYAPYTK